MSIVLFFVFVPLVVGVTVAFSVWMSRKWNDIFRLVAGEHGLEFSKGGFLRSPSVSGEIGGARLHIFRKSFSHGKSSTQTIGFSVRFPPAPRRLDITPEGFLSRLSKWGSNGDIELNDADFDNAALIAGTDAVAVRALLHPEARAIIVRLIRRSYARKFTLAGGLLETYQEQRRFSGAADLSGVIRDILRLKNLLSRPGSDEELLRENFAAEKDDRCRTAYFESLSAAARRLDADDEAVRAALSSRHPPLEFLAIKAIGAKADRLIPDVFARAGADLALEIVAYLEERRAGRLVPELAARVDETTDWNVKAALARLAAASEYGAAEKCVQKFLETGKNGPGDFKRECIRALGRCGGKSSIEFLYYLKGAFIRREVEESISAIRSRLGLEETGMLSLGEPEADTGNLSLADGEPETDRPKPRAGLQRPETGPAPAARRPRKKPPAKKRQSH